MEAVQYIVSCVQDYQFRLFWAVLLFMAFLPRRRLYPVRVLVWAPFLCLPLIIDNGFESDIFRIYGYSWSFMAWYAYAAVALLFCHKLNWGNFAYVIVSAYAIQNLFADFRYFLLYALFKEESFIYDLASLALMLGIYGVTFLLFVLPWNKKVKLGISLNKKYLIAIVVGILLFLNVFSSLMVNSVADGLALAELCLMFGICSFMILVLLGNAYDKSYLQYEKETMDRMLSEQDRQRKLSQQTVDLINMKCHDLKHQLSALQEGACRKDSEDFYKKTVESISIYDSYFNTGNSSLDLVLTEKSLLCNENKINFSCIADGSALNFMSASDIYSFFGNAIDNAVECLLQYEEENRNLSLNVFRAKAEVVIVSIENYCDRPIAFENGLPVTVKADKSYHGFGTRSMRYIVETLYGGNLVMQRRGTAFLVTASIPIPAKLGTQADQA